MQTSHVSMSNESVLCCFCLPLV